MKLSEVHDGEAAVHFMEAIHFMQERDVDDATIDLYMKLGHSLVQAGFDVTVLEDKREVEFASGYFNIEVPYDSDEASFRQIFMTQTEDVVDALLAMRKIRIQPMQLAKAAAVDWPYICAGLDEALLVSNALAKAMKQ